MSKTKVVSFIKIIAVVIALVFGGVMMLAMYRDNRISGGTFTWYIQKTDGIGGQYYEKYEQALPVQWLNNQYWDVENGGIAESGGKNIKLSFTVPISGSSKDYFGNMMASGDYTDIIDLTDATDSPRQLVESGILIELTEYVEKYMPNYVNFLNEHQVIKDLTTVKDDDGKTHYYALYMVYDKPDDPFMGYCYRRDWVVEYADVPSHVWDRKNVLKDENDPTSVDTSKIHYTDYYQAQQNQDWTGWVEQNEITGKFTSEEGDDPNNTYTDNVIFPSGTDKPVYISDWEWMFRAFKKALDAEGLKGDSNAYCTTVYYEGVLGTGDLYSSFGGGNPMWYYTTDENGKKQAAFGGDSDNMKVYLEAMNNWYKNDWLDKKFDQRKGDFFKINSTGVMQGKVGLCQMGMAFPGTMIRDTQHDGAKTRAMIVGCSLPINDLYGEESNKYNIPDSMYSDKVIGNATGVSVKALEKAEDLPALFTMMNWLYSEEGGCLTTYGLSAEQYASMEFSEDYYAEYGIDSGAYYVGEDGKYYFDKKAWDDTQLQGALKAQRLATSVMYQTKKGNVFNKVRRSTVDEWARYANTTDVTVYTTFMDREQNTTYNKRMSKIVEHLDTSLPDMIRYGFGKNGNRWNNYKTKMKNRGYDDVNEIYNSIFEKLS